MKSSSRTIRHITLESPGGLGFSNSVLDLPPQGTRPGASIAPPGTCRVEHQSGCAGHVLILPGVPAIGCDVTSGVSGESREGERES